MSAETTQPPDLIQPVLTGLRERFGDAIREVSGHRGEVTIELDTARLVEMVVFIGTVFIAYAYVWRRGGLEWD